jgi:hypothetical protein
MLITLIVLIGSFSPSSILYYIDQGGSPVSAMKWDHTSRVPGPRFYWHLLDFQCS